MPIFNEALSVVQAVEAHLIAERGSDVRFFAYLQRLIWFPVKFLKMGVSEKAKSASIWAILAFAFLMLGAWIVNSSGIARTEVANIVMLASMIFPMFLVVFAMPSVYADSGVASISVSFVVAHLHSRGFRSASDIELLKKSVRPFEERSRARVTVLKWLVGLLWAGFVYMVSKGAETFMATPSQALSYVMASAWLLVCVLAAYLLVWGYEASLDKLFRAIEFGCNDFCHVIEQPGHGS